MADDAHLCAYTRGVEWIPARIQAERHRVGWTQRELAERIGASLRSVTAWELGESTPTAKYRRALDRHLAPTAPTDRFDAKALRDSLTPDQLRQLVAEVDDLIIISDIARRIGLGRTGPRALQDSIDAAAAAADRLPDRTWTAADLPTRDPQTGDDDRQQL